MSRNYALDESIVKGALEGKANCLNAIRTIIKRCDAMAWNSAWFHRCYPPATRQAYRQAGYHVLRMMKIAFAWQGKLCQETEAPPCLPDESGIHRKDLWLVRLAYTSGACIVTTDRRLLEAVRSKGMCCELPDDV